MQSNILRVHHYGDTPEEDRRVTLSPMDVSVLLAETEDATVQGRAVRRVTVVLSSGGIELAVNHSDLELLENTIGFFCFE